MIDAYRSNDLMIDWCIRRGVSGLPMEHGCFAIPLSPRCTWKSDAFWEIDGNLDSGSRLTLSIFYSHLQKTRGSREDKKVENEEDRRNRRIDLLQWYHLPEWKASHLSGIGGDGAASTPDGVAFGDGLASEADSLLTGTLASNPSQVTLRFGDVPCQRHRRQVTFDEMELRFQMGFQRVLQRIGVVQQHRSLGMKRMQVTSGLHGVALDWDRVAFGDGFASASGFLSMEDAASRPRDLELRWITSDAGHSNRDTPELIVLVASNERTKDDELWESSMKDSSCDGLFIDQLSSPLSSTASMELRIPTLILTLLKSWVDQIMMIEAHTFDVISTKIKLKERGSHVQTLPVFHSGEKRSEKLIT